MNSTKMSQAHTYAHCHSVLLQLIFPALLHNKRRIDIGNIS